MDKLKYKIIKTQRQYHQYCNTLEYMIGILPKTTAIRDEIELLTLLIEKYDEEFYPLNDVDPISLLRSFMKEHNMKSKDLAESLGVGKGYVSDILNYNKGLSKEVVRKISDRFKVKQEAFNRPYPLKSKINIANSHKVMKVSSRDLQD